MFKNIIDALSSSLINLTQIGFLFNHKLISSKPKNQFEKEIAILKFQLERTITELTILKNVNAKLEKVRVDSELLKSKLEYTSKENQKLLQEKQQLEIQLESCEQDIKASNQHIEIFKKQIKTLEHQKLEKENIIHELRQKINEHEQEELFLKNELSRLTKNSTSIVDELSKKIDELQIEKNEFIQAIEKEKNKSKDEKKNLENQISELQSKLLYCNQRINELTFQISQKHEVVKRLQKVRKEINDENVQLQRYNLSLKNQLKNKDEELTSCFSRIEKLYQEMKNKDNEIATLRNTVAVLKLSEQQMENSIISLKEKNNKLFQLTEQQKLETNDLKTEKEKCKKLQEENKKLVEKLIESSKLQKTLKEKQNHIKKLDEEIKHHQIKLKMIEMENTEMISQLNAELQQLKADKEKIIKEKEKEFKLAMENWQKSDKKYMNEISSLRNEVQKLKHNKEQQLHEKDTIILMYKNINSELDKQIQHLKEKEKSLNNELQISRNIQNDQKIKLKTMEKEVTASKALIQLFKYENHQLLSENNLLRHEIEDYFSKFAELKKSEHDLNKTVKALKIHCNELENTCNQLIVINHNNEQKISDLCLKNSLLEKSKSRNLEAIKNLENENMKLKSQLITVNKEIEKLNLSNNKNSENELHKQLMEKNIVIQQLESKIQDLSNRLCITQCDCKNYIEQNTKLNVQLKNVNNLYNTIKVGLSQLKSENECLKKNTNANKKDIIEFTKSITELITKQLIFEKQRKLQQITSLQRSFYNFRSIIRQEHSKFSITQQETLQAHNKYMQQIIENIINTLKKHSYNQNQIISHFKNQIDILRKKDFKLNQKNNALFSENQQLNSHVTELNEKILNLEHENHRISNDLKERLQIEIVHIEENKRYKQQIDKLSEQLNSLKKEIVNLKEEKKVVTETNKLLERSIQEYKNLQIKQKQEIEILINQYENKIQVLTTDYETIIQQKLSCVQQLEHRIKTVADKFKLISECLLQMKSKYEQNLQKKEFLNSQLSSKLSNLSIKLQQSVIQIQNLEKDKNELNQEIRSLKSEIRKITNDKDLALNEYSEAVKVLQETNKEKENKIEELKKRLDALTAEFKKKADECTLIEGLQRNQNELVNDIKNKFTECSNENKQLKQTNQTLSERLDDVKNQLNILTLEKQSKITKLNNEIIQLRDNLKRDSVIYEKFKISMCNEIKALKDEKENLNKNLLSLQKENLELKNLREKLEKDAKSTVSHLIESNKQLTMKIDILTKTNNESNEKYKEMINNLNSDKQMLEEKLKNLSKDNYELKQKLDITQQQFLNFRNSKENEISEILQHKNILENDLNTSSKLITTIKQENSQLINEKNDLSKKLDSLAYENKELNETLNAEKNILLQLKSLNMKQENELLNLTLEKSQLIEKIKLVEEKNNELSAEISSLKEDTEQMQDKIESLIKSNSNISAQLTAEQQKNEKNKNEIAKLILENCSLNDTLKNYEQEKRVSIQTIASLEQKYSIMNETIKTEVDKYTFEISQLKKSLDISEKNRIELITKYENKLETMVLDYSKQLNENNLVIQQLKKDKDDVFEELKQQKNICEESTKHINTLQEKNRELENLNQKLKTTIAQDSQTISQKEKIIAELSSQLREITTELEQTRTGLQESILKNKELTIQVKTTREQLVNKVSSLIQDHDKLSHEKNSIIQQLSSELKSVTKQVIIFSEALNLSGSKLYNQINLLITPMEKRINLLSTKLNVIRSDVIERITSYTKTIDKLIRDKMEFVQIVSNLKRELTSMDQKAKSEISKLMSDIQLLKQKEEETKEHSHKKINELQSHLSQAEKQLKDFEKEKQKCINELTEKVSLSTTKLHIALQESSNIKQSFEIAKKEVNELKKKLQFKEKMLIDTLQQNKQLELSNNDLHQLLQDLQYTLDQTQKSESNQRIKLEEKESKIKELIIELELTKNKQCELQNITNETNKLINEKDSIIQQLTTSLNNQSVELQNAKRNVESLCSEIATKIKITESLTKKLQIADEINMKLKQENKERFHKMQETQEKISILESTVSILKNALKESKEKNEKFNKTIDDLKRKAKEDESKITLLKNELTSLEKRFSQSEQQCKVLESESKEWKIKYEELETKSKHQSFKLKEQVSKLKNTYETTINNLKETLKSISGQISRFRAQKRKSTDSTGSTGREFEKLQQQILIYSKKNEEVEQLLSKTKTDVEKKMLELSAVRQSKDELVRQFTAKEKQVEELQSTVEILHKNVKKYKLIAAMKRRNSLSPSKFERLIQEPISRKRTTSFSGIRKCNDFQNAISDVPGILIWRITKDHVLPTSQVGIFFETDVYLVLCISKIENNIEYHVHTWIGNKASFVNKWLVEERANDLEQSIFEIKKKIPYRHRQVQLHESKTLLKQFKDPIYIILEDYIQFTAEKRNETVLYQIEGKQSKQVEKVPLNCASLNKKDVFILVSANQIFLWSASKYEVDARLNNVLDLIKGEKIKLTEKGNDMFWKLLGGKTEISPRIEITTTDYLEKTEMKFVRVITDKGVTEFKQVDHLNIPMNSEIFIVDKGNQILILLGKNVNQTEKRNSIKYAVKYLEKFSQTTPPITRVIEGSAVAENFWTFKVC